MNHEEINWGEKPLGEIEEVLDDMSPKERTLFLKYLGTHYPHLKIDYVYEFLESCQLISSEGAEKMRENNLYHRNQMIGYMKEDLWQTDFVFKWPDHEKWDDLRNLFEGTFEWDKQQVVGAMDDFAAGNRECNLNCVS